MRRAAVIGWTLAVLAILNGMIASKEAVVREGTRVLLELRPRDPRSLMQGDYMVLRYAFGREAPNPLPDGRSPHGTLVARLDAAGVAHFRRFDDGGPLATDEVRLRYSPSEDRGAAVKVAPESYLFQEGHAQTYQRARYAEARVDADGTLVLIGLLDDRRERLVGADE